MQVDRLHKTDIPCEVSALEHAGKEIDLQRGWMTGLEIFNNITTLTSKYYYKASPRN